jgi:hypothetical protein
MLYGDEVISYDKFENVEKLRQSKLEVRTSMEECNEEGIQKY